MSTTTISTAQELEDLPLDTQVRVSGAGDWTRVADGLAIGGSALPLTSFERYVERGDLSYETPDPEPVAGFEPRPFLSVLRGQQWAIPVEEQSPGAWWAVTYTYPGDSREANGMRVVSLPVRDFDPAVDPGAYTEGTMCTPQTIAMCRTLLAQHKALAA